MIVVCPSCKAKFKIDEDRIKPPGVRLRCGKCRTFISVRKRVIDAPVRDAPVPGVAQDSVRTRAPVSSDDQANARVKVLVAHEDPDVREAMKTAVERSGHEVLSSKDGVDALMKIQRDHPRVVVMDAALPRMHGFEICEFLKRDERLREIKVILLEPCTARSRHKRSAENIYGADDIVDAQRVREDLPARLTGLIAGSLPVSERASTGSEQSPSADSSSRVASPVERQSEGLPSGGGRPRVRNAGAGSDTAADPDPLEVEREKARRLARIIVSDIALYNEGLIELGLRKGGLVDLLRDHLEEGYRLFRSRVRESIAEEADYVREALDAFVERKRGELGIENPGGGPEGNGIGKDER